ncbi:4-(cytidine 5'-diphospho)-2-C-methyl-D-erythritol kinase [Hyphococcus formosus]|uniref:4-(cytidine 5'-diphospho)-2-C-methyl-D-erythritol kinase n=1 Tax=Hyphococcus formosus TaxID=3143534 RepID=UPI00398B0C78
MIVETAPAKINLYLHVGGVRPDGLHDLASLFVFTEGGDVIRVTNDSVLSLEVTGPFAEPLKTTSIEDNLVYRAARRLAEYSGTELGAKITLEKNLPIAAGIGGGSADAAATLRALVKLWRIGISDTSLAQLAFSLGADIPACLFKAPVNVTGAGEILEKGPVLPPLWACLVNPRVQMPTGPIFRAFDRKYPSPPNAELIPIAGTNYTDLTEQLAKTRNDLEPFARHLAPVVGEVIDMLDATPGSMAARMSGSGATCFALFNSREGAERAANRAKSFGSWALASRLHVR